jgi:hypothetical protein
MSLDSLLFVRASILSNQEFNVRGSTRSEYWRDCSQTPGPSNHISGTAQWRL